MSRATSKSMTSTPTASTPTPGHRRAADDGRRSFGRRRGRWPSSADGRALQRLVGHVELSVTVRERDLELGDESEPIAVEGLPAPPAEPAAVPTVAERDLDDGVLPHERADVIGAVPEPPLVAGPARAEHVVADRLRRSRTPRTPRGSIQQHGRHDNAVSLRQIELTADDGRAVEVIDRRDHRRGPRHDRLLGRPVTTGRPRRDRRSHPWGRSRRSRPSRQRSRLRRRRWSAPRRDCPDRRGRSVPSPGTRS